MTIQKITKLIFPVGKKKLSQNALYRALSEADSGFYPIGKNRLWHGGLHIDKAVIAALQANTSDHMPDVKCMADGEIIAYRLNDTYPYVDYDDKVTFYSTGFVLVRHLLRMEYVDLPLSTDNEFEVIRGNDVIAKGANVRDFPKGNKIGYLSNGAEITIDLDNEYLDSSNSYYWYPIESINNGYSSLPKLNTIEVKIPDDNSKTKNCLGWISLGKTKLTDKTQTLEKQNDDQSTNSALQKGLAIRTLASTSGDMLSLLPIGSKLKVSEFDEEQKWAKVASLSEGSYSSTPQITGWLSVTDLQQLPIVDEKDKKSHSLYLYSLYMHLADMLHYEHYTKAEVPSHFTKNTYQVTKTGLDNVEGLNIRNKPESGEKNKNNILAVLQNGTKVKVHLDFHEKGKATWYAVASLCDGYHSIPELSAQDYTLADGKTSKSILGWIYIEGKVNESGEHIINEKKPDTNSKSMGLRVRKSPKSSDKIISMLPEGCEISIRGKINKNTHTYIKINHNDVQVNKATLPLEAGDYYIWSEALSLKKESQQYNQIIVLDEPLQVKAGDVIGHVGHYQHHQQKVKKMDITPNIYLPVSTIKPYEIEPLLHVEMFTCEDLSKFITTTQTEAAKIKEKDKPLLLVDKGAKLYSVDPQAKTVSIAANIDVSVVGHSDEKWSQVKECYTLTFNAKDYGYEMKNVTELLTVNSTNKTKLLNLLKTHLSDTTETITNEAIPDKLTFTGTYINPTMKATTTDKAEAIKAKSGYSDITVELVRQDRLLWVESSELNEGRKRTLSTTLSAWKNHPLTNAKTDKNHIVGYPQLIPLNELNNFSLGEKAVDESGNVWCYITAGSDKHLEIKGWVNTTKQEHLKRVSPWQWLGFEQIEERKTLADLSRLNLMTDEQFKQHEDNKIQQVEPVDYEGSVLLKHLSTIIKNINHDEAEVPLNDKHLKAALRHPWIAQQLGHILVKYESEWYSEFNEEGKMPKWEALNDQFTYEMQSYLDFSKDQVSKQQTLAQIETHYRYHLGFNESKISKILQEANGFLDNLANLKRQAKNSSKSATDLTAFEDHLENNIALWTKEKRRIKTLLWWNDIAKKLAERQNAQTEQVEDPSTETETNTETSSNVDTESPPLPSLSSNGQAWFLHPVGMQSFASKVFMKGDQHELIREVNIRLAGFGGNVPTDYFDDRTEQMIKQFQRDYMKVSETGVIDESVLNAIDDFQQKYPISSSIWNSLKCSCESKGKLSTSLINQIKEINNCGGFGDRTGNNTLPEQTNKYEYPGIHRSLLNALRALFFYLDRQDEYQFALISSGYRCRFKQYSTTNHQGKAIDIQFNKGSWQIRSKLYKNIAPLLDIKEKFFEKYLNTQTRWATKNLFSLEPIGLNKDNSIISKSHTYSWIHLDVRTFDKGYLADEFFCKNISELNQEKLLVMFSKLS